MKRLLFIGGTFALMMLSLGFLLRLMEYEGSGLLILFGLAGFTLILIVGAVKQKNLLFYTSSLTMILLLLAWVFSGLELPGANLLFMSGMLVLTLILLPLMGFWIYKHSESR
jgi:hypothetical protein